MPFAWDDTLDKQLLFRLLDLSSGIFRNRFAEVAEAFIPPTTGEACRFVLFLFHHVLAPSSSYLFRYLALP